MLDDHCATGGEWDERFCRVAEDRLGPVTWDQVRRLHDSSNAEAVIRQLGGQAQGVLINHEMPWNPMRVEQRIGRIDRIGQDYDRVWIRNYFYDGTVEATVYQRLDEHIASL